MANKNFLYGLVLGILGCNGYPLIKDKLRPMAVKIVEGAIVTGSTTKSFMEEVNVKAREHRQERFRKASENFESKSVNSKEEVSESIEALRKELEGLKKKIKGV